MPTSRTVSPGWSASCSMAAARPGREDPVEDKVVYGSVKARTRARPAASPMLRPRSPLRRLGFEAGRKARKADCRVNFTRHSGRLPRGFVSRYSRNRMRRVARPRNEKNPKTSVNVVMITLDAIAGSTRNVFSAIGHQRAHHRGHDHVEDQGHAEDQREQQLPFPQVGDHRDDQAVGHAGGESEPDLLAEDPAQHAGRHVAQRDARGPPRWPSGWCRSRPSRPRSA